MGKLWKSGRKMGNNGGSATAVSNRSKLSSFKRELSAEEFVTSDWGNERLDYVSSAELGNEGKRKENAHSQDVPARQKSEMRAHQGI